MRNIKTEWENQEQIIRFGIIYLETVFNNIYKAPPRSAHFSAIYYNLFIFQYPTRFANIQRLAERISPRISFSALRNGRMELLELGFIAAIIPTMNEKVGNYLRGEAYLPVNPEVFKAILPSALDLKLFFSIEIEKKYFDAITEIYNKKISYNAVKPRLKSQGPFERSSTCNLSIYYSTSWAFYNILGNIDKHGSSTLYMICSADELNEHYDIFKRIISYNLSIKLVIIKDSTEEINELIKLTDISNTNIKLRIATREEIGNNRIAILDDVFALDGRTLLQGTRKGPSNIGTIYLDQESMTSLTSIFNSIWDRLQASI